MKEKGLNINENRDDIMYELVNNLAIDDLEKELKNFRFEKDYLMNFRGHAEGHVILMDLSTGKAYSNRAAKHLVEHYEKIFNKGGM